MQRETGTLSYLHIRRMIRDAGFAEYGSCIEALMLPAIRIRTHTLRDDDLPIGSSKIGGVPDLPAGFDWPIYCGKQLPFLAQFYLPDAIPYDACELLPDTGMLYFFYTHVSASNSNADAAKRCKTLYFNGDRSALSRYHLKEHNDTHALVYKPCSVTFSAELTLPPWTTFSQYYTTPVKTNQHISSVQERYHALERAFNKMYHDRIDDHHLLGHPNFIRPLSYQPDTEVVLFQIDSDFQTGMCWSDDGRVYFFIERTALQRRIFNDIRVDWDCY